MKRILVIQLLRIGDILQTTPALAGLREQNPASYIAVLVRKVFAQPLLNNQAIDEVITWDVDSLLRELFDKQSPLGENYQRVQTFIDELRAREFDTVINLTNDFLSALITYLLNPDKVVGLTYRPDGSLKINGSWIKYLFLVPKNRRYNRYNLVDILANACGVKETGRALSFITTQEDENFAHHFLQRAGDRLLIGLQPGTSKGFKRWPAESFAELGDQLVKKHKAQIILFGSADEINLGAEISGLMKEPAINAVGTTLGQLAALLKKCALLITNDTGPMHVAAAVGTRTFLLSFGPVCSYQVCPYGNGHFVLEPDMDCFPCSSLDLCPSLTCRDLLTIDSVIKALELALSIIDNRYCAKTDDASFEGHGKLGHLVEELDSLILYRSVLDFRLKRLTLVPVNRPGRVRVEEILKELYAHFWERMCNNDIIYPLAPPGSREPVEFMNCCLKDDTQRSFIVDGLREYIRDFQNLERLADAGIQMLRSRLSVGDPTETSFHQCTSIAAILEQIAKSLTEVKHAVKFLTAHFLLETRLIGNMPVMAVATTYLRLLQNLKAHARFFVSYLTSIESKIARENTNEADSQK